MNLHLPEFKIIKTRTYFHVFAAIFYYYCIYSALIEILTVILSHHKCDKNNLIMIHISHDEVLENVFF